jgi:hypothetical protein
MNYILRYWLPFVQSTAIMFGSAYLSGRLQFRWRSQVVLKFVFVCLFVFFSFSCLFIDFVYCPVVALPFRLLASVFSSHLFLSSSGSCRPGWCVPGCSWASPRVVVANSLAAISHLWHHCWGVFLTLEISPSFTVSLFSFSGFSFLELLGRLGMRSAFPLARSL